MTGMLSHYHGKSSSRVFAMASRCLYHHISRQSLCNSAKLPQTLRQPKLGRGFSAQLFSNRGHVIVAKKCSISSFNKMSSGAFLPLFRQGNQMIGVRLMSSKGGSGDTSKTDTLLYVLSLLVLSVGLAYAGVPFFKMFCRQFGLGGNPEISKGHDRSKVSSMQRVEDREITVRFNADTHASMKWNFKPQQTKIKVKPGETALAFYTAENPTDKPIIGISTYTVTPYIAAPYFNKIQCFCFEEQILNPHEQVDMPVFFYIDPEYDEDPQLEFEDSITLSYTFFEAKEGMSLPLPGFIQPSAKPSTAPAENVGSVG